MTRWFALSCGVALLGCAGAPSERADTASAGRASPAASNAPRTAEPAPTRKASPQAHTDSPVIAAPVDRTPFTRVLEAPVRRIAIDREPYVSALGKRVAHVHDAKGWREEALPAAALTGAALELFYGRDYRLRLVGTRGGEADLETLYYRWLPGGFRAAPDEIGRLGSTRRGGFVALLGTADPEVVCRPGDVCLIKRVSGWATIKAPAELALVAIHRGGAWAVAGQSLLRVEADKRWKTLSDAGPWAKADALWVTPAFVWVLESAAGRLHRFDGSNFQTSAVPTKRPRVLWGLASEALWLGGEEGLFRLVEAEWRKVEAVPGAVWAINGRTVDDVWVGGSSGLFRANPR
jgi:hypothetical protein